MTFRHALFANGNKHGDFVHFVCAARNSLLGGECSSSDVAASLIRTLEKTVPLEISAALHNLGTQRTFSRTPPPLP